MFATAFAIGFGIFLSKVFWILAVVAFVSFMLWWVKQ